ncbi:MAG: hypothetical protein KIPDCIKN_03468 [Haliscomenobacter sp.]|nr:hypothetical protein [Haliscomenobacter sp.]
MPVAKSGLMRQPQPFILFRSNYLISQNTLDNKLSPPIAAAAAL